MKVFIDSHLVETRSQAGLLGRGEYERLVVAFDDRVRHALKVPRPLADFV